MIRLAIDSIPNNYSEAIARTQKNVPLPFKKNVPNEELAHHGKT